MSGKNTKNQTKAPLLPVFQVQLPAFIPNSSASCSPLVSPGCHPELLFLLSLFLLQPVHSMTVLHTSIPAALWFSLSWVCFMDVPPASLHGTSSAVSSASSHSSPKVWPPQPNSEAIKWVLGVSGEHFYGKGEMSCAMLLSQLCDVPWRKSGLWPP